MIQYISIKGGISPVNFEKAILDGFAAEGGLYVPTYLPKITKSQLTKWKDLNYTDLAFEILSLFINNQTIPSKDLKQILKNSFSTFYHPQVIPIVPLKTRDQTYVQELFNGPSLSFKDVAMGFIVNLFDYFLKKKGEKMNIVVATTGDTGPAAAHASIGKEQLNTWVLYPKELITEEQERQMTTIEAGNVYPVAVANCPDGADDLDLLIAEMFANEAIKKRLNLSSVNSINWGRVMMQTVHYFFGYLQLVDQVGEEINFCVPSGAFGNLCAGSLARAMGLPVEKFIVANNRNTCLHRIFSKGIFSKKALIHCPSSAIDILVPYNFWRYLYFATGQNTERINLWMSTYEKEGRVTFDKKSHAAYSQGFVSTSISDKLTLDTIRALYENEKYLLDPHAAVAVATAQKVQSKIKNGTKTLCLATAHPSKFPTVVTKALKGDFPEIGKHASIEAAKNYCERGYSCNYKNMRNAIVRSMLAVG